MIVLALNIVLLLLVFWLLAKFLKKNSNLFLLPIPPDPEWINSINEEELVKKSFSRDYADKEFDCVVIGSGISGLSCASVLSQMGQKVLVLEQGEQIGGLLSEFTEDDFTFPTGVHVLGGINWKTQSNLMWMALFDKISEKQIRLIDKSDPLYVVHIGKKVYEIQEGTKWLGYLEKEFPEDAELIRKYSKLSVSILKEMQVILLIRKLPKLVKRMLEWVLEKVVGFKWWKLAGQSCRDHIESFFLKAKNADLVKIIQSFHGASGEYDKLPSQFNCIVFGSIVNGCSYPVHGSGDIARKVCRVITKYGGVCLCNARVESILVHRRGRSVNARGVKMVTGEKVYAKKIVSTAGIYNTYKLLSSSPPLRKSNLFKDLETEVRPSTGHFNVFLGLDVPYHELDLPKSTLILSLLEEGRNPLLGVSEYKPQFLIGSNMNVLCPENRRMDVEKSTTMVLIWDCPLSVFARFSETTVKNRGNEYDDLKTQLVNRTMEIFEEMYPKVKDHVVTCFGGTSLSLQHFHAWSSGESYGFQNDSNRCEVYEKYVKNLKVKNLLISGQDASICNGITPSMMEGIITAGEILKRNLLMELVGATKVYGEVLKNVKKE